MNSKSLKMKHPIRNKILSTFILVFFAVFLFISVILLVKYFIITLSGLYEPVFNLIKLILSEENTKNSLIHQVKIIFKILSLIISGGLIFVIYSVLSTVFCCIFYNLCSRKSKTINYPLKFSVVKVIKSTGYFLFLSLILLFNFFLKIAGISISFTAFTVSFISFSIIFVFILSLLVSCWQLFSTLFGTEIAISEPKLKNKTIEKRSKKLILSKNYNLLLCISYFMLILIIIFQIKYALTTDFLTNAASQKFFNLIIIGNLFCILIFEYLKTSGYINSLIEYDHKISKCPIKVIKT